ncbi:MAG: disulfide bond formation protein B [Proteobacteria bacterium]|nr:disulfide bond formation protein B [Pseudomonadota bacterium]
MLGTVSLVLILGALGFEYIGGYPPCEMCMWQRYPHFAAIVVGLGGGLLLQYGVLPANLAKPIAILTALLVAITGVIGIYHAGVEWKMWAGPAACTGTAFQITGKLDLNAHVVSCDHAAWRLFGISMAGYNALISLGFAIAGFTMLSREGKKA